MNLEAYRKRVQRRLVVMRILLVVFVGIVIASHLMEENFMSGFLGGAGVGGGFAALFILFQQSASLKDEKKLRKMYIADHDERLIAIRAKAGQPMVLCLSVGLIVAAAVAGFFSMTVMVTLYCAAMVQLVISLVVKFICMKRM